MPTAAAEPIISASLSAVPTVRCRSSSSPRVIAEDTAGTSDMEKLSVMTAGMLTMVLTMPVSTPYISRASSSTKPISVRRLTTSEASTRLTMGIMEAPTVTGIAMANSFL